MNSSSANFLDALGASQTFSAQMKHELDTFGYTVVHNVVDAQWLSEMRLLIDTWLNAKAIIWRWSTIRRRRRRGSLT